VALLFSGLLLRVLPFAFPWSAAVPGARRLYFCFVFDLAKALARRCNSTLSASNSTEENCFCCSLTASDFSQASERTSLNLLTIFGLVAVSAMVICYAFENRHTSFILAFALSCVLGSIYGFLQGAWPFGAVEAVWAVIAVRRWWLARGSGPVQPEG